MSNIRTYNYVRKSIYRVFIHLHKPDGRHAAIAQDSPVQLLDYYEELADAERAFTLVKNELNSNYDYFGEDIYLIEIKLIKEVWTDFPRGGQGSPEHIRLSSIPCGELRRSKLLDAKRLAQYEERERRLIEIEKRDRASRAKRAEEYDSLQTASQRQMLGLE